MVYTDEIYNNYSYTKSEKIPISLHKHFKSVSYKHILNLLKNNNILVTLDHKDYKIKEIRGSIIVLDNNKSLRIDEIKNIKLPVPNLELLEENIDMNYKTPTIGERALISIGNSKFIGLIIGNEFVTNKFLYIYKDDKGYKLGVTSQYNIVGTEIPRNTNQNIINNDDLINISYYINNILKNNKSVQSILEKDYDRLNNLTFNVSDLNNYSTILSDDILYNPETKLLYKVIDSGYNLINGIKHFYIKTVVKMSDNTFRYFNIDRNSLHNYILFTKRLNESFANLSIQKSRIEVFREPQVQSKSYVEVKVYKNPNNFIFILPANVNPIESNIAEKGYKDITQEYKKLMQDRYKWENIPDKLYAIATNNYYKKDSLNTNFVEMSKENFIKMLRSNELYKIIPGSFISLGKNVLVIEKILKNALVATKYSYTKIPNGNGEFRYVKGETVILDEYTDLNIKGIFTPKWAINTYEFISKYKNNIEKEETKINVKSSSYEFLVNFSNYLSEKFNIKINLIKNSDLERFNNPKVYQASSFTTFDEIYINLDKARITDPLHELLHVILATMKARNSDMYYRIINSVQYHPIFKEVAGNMINAEALEESFIKLFTLTFNKNIKSDGIFSDDGFNTTIKDTISDMLNLEENLDWEDVNGLMKTSIYDVLTNFGSKLIDGEESLIDFNSSYEMFTVADIIQKLIDEKKLEQKCNY